MTTEQRHEIINQISYELKLYPYQVELLKRIFQFDGQIRIVPCRMNGRKMLNDAYYEVIKRLNEEELK